MDPSNSPSPHRPGDDPTGRLLQGRYRLERTIASGGMATVWDGTDQLLSRRVAIKVLHAHLAHDQAFRTRFRAEAVASARLAHPGIVAIYDTIEDGSISAIVMELVRGTTLRAELDRHGPVQLSALLAIGTQVADALGSAHAAGLVHRDVKPANILLSNDGRVLVADFGIAKAAHSADLTETGSMIGTAKYLSPEQVEGRPVDHRSDLYSLGIVLYEALTGRAPFTGDNDAAIALARLRHDPVPIETLRPDAPAAVRAVVERAMARSPEHRFDRAESMRRALLAAGAPPAPPRPAPHPAPAPRTVVAPRPTTTAVRIPRRRRRRRILASILGIAAVLLLLMAFVLRPFDRSRGTELPITATVDVDPAGDGENPHLLPNLVDGDPDTLWHTETYLSGPHLDKGGVGFALSLDEPHTLTQLVLDTPTGGWDASIHISGADTVPRTFEDWDGPTAAVTDAATGRVVVGLDDTMGQHVLVWFTRLTPAEDERFDVRIGEANLRGR